MLSQCKQFSNVKLLDDLKNVVALHLLVLNGYTVKGMGGIGIFRRCIDEGTAEKLRRLHGSIHPLEQKP
ncbi:hypothetical protein [Brasilonema sp. UFV-L1]|uniref:hypothetical protein n=1 Tax=Brasilonema sp. UFV-L1 TaxID=2234130 RepID=UPI00145C9DD1|nr:hypothetical protein [Brasilonema sp. UFV-L1]